MNNTTEIPATTIRRYIQTFDDILPQGVKLDRAWKYPGKINAQKRQAAK